MAETPRVRFVVVEGLSTDDEVPSVDQSETTTAAEPGEPKHGDLRARTFRSMLWVAAERWTNRLLSLVTFAIIGRFLQPAEIGLVALAATFLAFCQLFADQGFSDALIQRADLDDSHADSAFWVSVTTALLLYGAVLATASPVSNLLGTPGLAPVLRVLAITLVLSSLSSTPAALLERDFGFKRLSQRRVISNLVGGIVGVTLAVTGAGVWAVVAQSLTSAGIGVIFLWTVVAWRPRLRVQWDRINQLRTVGLSIIGIQIFAFINSQADRFFIGTFLSPSALGFYYVAMRIITILLDVQASVIQAVSLTALSKLQDDLPRFRRAFLTFTGTSAVVGVLAYASFAALAPVVIPLVFGPQWHRSIVIAQILCAMGALNSVLVFDRSALVALGRSRLAFSITATQSMVGLVAVAIAAPFGITAVAIAVSVRQYLVWPVRMRALSEALGLPISSYFFRWARPAVAGVIVVLVVGSLVEIFAPGAHATLEQCAFTIGGSFACLAVYLGVGRVLFPETLEDLKGVIRRRT